MIPILEPTKIVERSQKRGVFVLEGLYPGYGVTVGNSLRRVLLSSLEGAAPTLATIKGVEHEFSTLPGVAEDVLNILLNVKQMRFRLHGKDAQKAVLKAKGEKEVKGSDFQLPASLELMNEDCPIAELTSKSAQLEMEIQVERGVGYVPAEERKKERQGIGTIALDAAFSPVRKVSSRVENMRVGDRTDFNRLTLEVETDGSLTPEEAFVQACDILLKQFEAARSSVALKLESAPPAEPKKAPKKKKKA